MSDPMALVVDALSTTGVVAGPLLAASLAAGLAVGIAQAVVQVNEASLSFLVKLGCVAAVLVVMGATLAGALTTYTGRCFGAIEKVVHDR